MKRIASLIPTYHRHEKLQGFIRNHNSTSKEAKLYFIVHPDDLDTQVELQRLGEEFLICPDEYVGCINFGFASTNEEFVLCASDDVVFNEGWDEELLSMADGNPDKHIFGGIDEWKVNRTLLHISHPLIRRNHFSSPLYYPEYIHYMCDVEFIQKGLRDNCVMITPQILIDHPHTITDEEKDWDDTYKRSFSKIKHDEFLYLRRRYMFEQYDFFELDEGRVIPTKQNPLYSETVVSIVIPTFNDADFLKGVLQSIVNNTYYRYEIIIIDNGSDPIQKTKNPWDKIDTTALLESLQLQDQSCKLVVKRLPKNVWVNPVWNMGAEMATGKYVAVINADIELSKDWDKYLVSALETPTHKFTISCPYETNPHVSVPYALDKWFMKHVPHMLKGPCFMFRKADVPMLFPIPPEIKHWCGDNLLADRATEKGGGVVYAKKAQIYHYVTQAGNRVKRSKITNRTYQDILAYEKYTGKNCEWLKATFPDVVREYYMYDKKVDF